NIYYTAPHSPDGGAAILIHNSIQHKSIPLQSTVDSIALEIQSVKKFNIIATYIPPNKKFNQIDLHSILSPENSPNLI
ncbi:hypothetical protein KR074_003959, partial [Drosophila pseudoananassae]